MLCIKMKVNSDFPLIDARVTKDNNDTGFIVANLDELQSDRATSPIESVST